MRLTPTSFDLSDAERATLQRWMHAETTEQRLVLRARIVLAAAAGEGTNAIARRLGVRAATVSKWRCRFAKKRLDGLRDRAGRGRPRMYTKEDERRVLAKLDDPPPRGYAQWNGRLVAEALGDVSSDYVWSVLRKHGIQLQRRKSWCVSTDPEFAAKAADVIGLYLDPPENAVVLCVDEKPHIQALERAQGYLRLPNGRALTGYSHQYKRNGTTTLFAALEVATGLVHAGHFKRRRRVEFLDFMNRVVAAHPDKAIHVILDNLSTHKPKRDLWLQKHPNVHFHFIPTKASWLNLVEVWFSLLSRHALKGASFSSVEDLRRAIDEFTDAHNENAHPFEWTKEVVYQKTPKFRYADLVK